MDRCDMVDPEIVRQIYCVIDEVEANAQAKLALDRDSHPGVRSVYEKPLDAVALCRAAADRVSQEQDDLSYMREMIAVIEKARQTYTELFTDQDGYGNATFHMINQQVSQYYESVKAIMAYVDLIDDAPTV